MIIKKISYYIFLTLVHLIVFSGFSQNSKLVTKNDLLNVKLKSHILIYEDSISKETLKILFKKEVPLALKLPQEGKISSTFLNDYIKFYKELVVISTGEYKDVFEDLKIINIDEKEIGAIVFEPLKIKALKNKYKNDIEEYRSINLKEYKSNLSDSLFLKFWEISGKIPNFIYASNQNIVFVDSIVQKLNSYQKVFGKINSSGKLLRNVSFKNYKNRSASGFFSFPIYNELPILIPHKAGFHFSPDIIYLTPENYRNLKEFTGFKLDQSNEISDHIVFKQGVKNLIRNNNSEIISDNLKIEFDSDLGEVGLFENRAFINAGLASSNALQGNFTITAWIKPTKLGANNSILGKGKNFVLKIRNGYLTFTMAGIKDYMSKSTKIPINKWSHISLVHSKIKNELLFYMNGNLTDKVELIADYSISDYNLLIGSNLWEEFFVGYLGDIKIWNRELNSDEILVQFQNPTKKQFEYNKYWIIGTLSFLILTIFFAVFYKKRKKNEQKNNKAFNQPVVTAVKKIHVDYTEQVICLGELKIIDSLGVNIGAKLSPKLKSLFILILLHSGENKKGINSKKLTEILWPGMTTKGAKNTRGTSIQHLRTLLSSCSEIELVFQDKNWKINLSNKCYCDYHLTLGLLQKKLNDKTGNDFCKNELSQLIDMLSGGRFLVNSNYSWLDPYVEKFSNLVISQTLNYTGYLDLKNDAELLLKITDVINIYDDLNEKSLKLKLQILRYQGKLSLAHTVYDSFTKLYKTLYKEEYSKSFEDLISKNISEFV